MVFQCVWYMLIITCFTCHLVKELVLRYTVSDNMNLFCGSIFIHRVKFI